MDTLRELAIDMSERFTLLLSYHPWTHVPVALLTSLAFVIYRTFKWSVAKVFITPIILIYV